MVPIDQLHAKSISAVLRSALSATQVTQGSEQVSRVGLNRVKNHRVVQCTWILKDKLQRTMKSNINSLPGSSLNFSSQAYILIMVSC